MSTNTYTPIATITSTGASNITFSSIPSTYTDLILIIANQRLSSSGDAVRMQYNGDTGNNYSNTNLTGTGSSAISYRESNVGSIRVSGIGVGVSTTVPATTIIQIQNYSNTTTYKTNLSRFSDAGTEVGAVVGLWRSTAAINSITLSSAYMTSGVVYSLYGIKAA